MDFLLVRHVETMGNVQKRFAGITDVKYTEQGKKQFTKLTHFLKNHPVDIIYSSPLSRTLDIAKKVGEDTNTPVKVVEELSEMNFGIFENLTFQDIVMDYQKYWLKWEEDYVNYQIPGGESLKLFHRRVIHFLDSIKNDCGKCMLICHGGTIQSIIIHLLNLQITDRGHFHIPLGGIVKISYENHFGMLKSLIPLDTL